MFIMVMLRDWDAFWPNQWVDERRLALCSILQVANILRIQAPLPLRRRSLTLFSLGDEISHVSRRNNARHNRVIRTPFVPESTFSHTTRFCAV